MYKLVCLGIFTTIYYHIHSKYLDTITPYHNCPKIWTSIPLPTDTVNILKFHTPKVWQNVTCKQCRPRSDCSWRSSLIRVYTDCHSTKYFKKQLHKKQNLGKKSMEKKKFKILGHLPYVKKICWMSSGVDSDKTPTFCGVWSRSTLFSQACLSKYLG